MRRRLALAFIITTALVRIEPGEAVRATRRDCKQACDPKVVHDCTGLPGPRYRACRKAILRKCRRSSLESCFLTPTVTTTSLGSDTSLHVTTTTRASTSTTLFSYGGQWSFSGTLTTDSCDVGAPTEITGALTIIHTPGSSGLSINVNGSFVLAGSASPAGFHAEETHPIELGCTVGNEISASSTSDPDHMNAVLGSSAACRGEECRVAWSGELVR